MFTTRFSKWFPSYLMHIWCALHNSYEVNGIYMSPLQCAVHNQWQWRHVYSIAFTCIMQSSSNYAVKMMETMLEILVVRSSGRGLGNLFTAVVNHVTPSRRRCGYMIRHSREQVSKSPATWPYNEFIILQNLKTFTMKSIILTSSVICFILPFH